MIYNYSNVKRRPLCSKLYVPPVHALWELAVLPLYISSPENSGKQLLQILTSLLTANDCLHLSPPTIALAPLTGNVHVTKANRCLLSCCVAEHLLEGFLFPKAVSSLGGITVLSMYCSGCLVAIVSLLSVFNLIFKSVVAPEGR